MISIDVVRADYDANRLDGVKINNLELIDYSKRKNSSLKIDSGIFESFVDGGTAFLNSSSYSLFNIEYNF